MSRDLEIAQATLEPHFDAVRDTFARFEVEPGKPLARLRRVVFEVTERAHSSERHFAATYETGLLMIFAPEIVDKPWETVVAIVAHEFGHAADFAYPACWSWPKGRAGGESLWVGETARARAHAWRALYGKPGARSRSADDDRPPASTWAFAWQRRSADEVEWAADAIAEAVTGRQIGYAGDCMLQTFDRGVARPAGLR
jgi:hypothetical protein